MDNKINFSYVLGWLEFLNSAPGNKFHFLKSCGLEKILEHLGEIGLEI